MKKPPDLDPECLSLFQAMNGLAGIATFESCCGHGQEPFRMWFKPDNFECLPDLLYWFNPCHSGLGRWICRVYTDCAKSPVVFVMESESVGAEAYEEADKIAALIQADDDKRYVSGAVT